MRFNSIIICILIHLLALYIESILRLIDNKFFKYVVLTIAIILICIGYVIIFNTLFEEV